MDLFGVELGQPLAAQEQMFAVQSRGLGCSVIEMGRAQMVDALDAPKTRTADLHDALDYRLDRPTDEPQRANAAFHVAAIELRRVGAQREPLTLCAQFARRDDAHRAARLKHEIAIDRDARHARVRTFQDGQHVTALRVGVAYRDAVTGFWLDQATECAPAAYGVAIDGDQHQTVVEMGEDGADGV